MHRILTILHNFAGVLGLGSIKLSHSYTFELLWKRFPSHCCDSEGPHNPTALPVLQSTPCGTPPTVCSLPPVTPHTAAVSPSGLSVSRSCSPAAKWSFTWTATWPGTPGSSGGSEPEEAIFVEASEHWKNGGVVSRNACGIAVV